MLNADTAFACPIGDQQITLPQYFRRLLPTLILLLASLLALCAGTLAEGEDAVPLTLDSPVSVSVIESEERWFSFVPEESDDYRFTSTAGNGQIYISWYNADRYQYDCVFSQPGEGLDVTWSLTGGEQYYFGVRSADPESEGERTLLVELAPKIVSIESSDELVPGGNYTMAVNVTARGNLALSYQWYYSPENMEYYREIIEGATGPAYQETGTLLGMYICEVNGADYVVFTPHGDNQFSAEYATDGDLYPEPGESAVMGVRVNAVDQRSISYKWIRTATVNGETVSETLEGITGNSYTETNVVSGTEYLCEVQDAFGSYETFYFTLYIENALTVSPVGDTYITARPGDTVRAEANVSATNMEGMTYTWVRSGLDMDGNYYSESLNGVNAPVFEETIVPGTREHNLFLTVRDAYGNEENLLFNVSVDNALTVEPVGDTELDVVPGTTATLNVNVTAHDAEGLTYRWRRSTYDVDYNWNEDDIGEATGATWMEPFATGLLHEYVECYVTDRYGNTESVRFLLRAKKSFTVSADGTSTPHIAPGNSATLKVNVTTDTPEFISYRWTREIPSNDGTLPTYEDIEGATSDTYCELIDNDQHIFACFVSDSYGNTEMVRFDVIVDNALTVEAAEAPEDILLGETLTLSVAATAIDMQGITYLWERECTPSWENNYEGYEPIPGASGNALSYVTQSTDCSYFRCTVTDRYGNSERIDFHVNVQAYRVPITEANFPDPAFRAYVAANCDRDGDGYAEDMDLITYQPYLVIPEGVTSIQGAELLRPLVLTWSDCPLQELVLPPMDELTNLTIGGISLTALDVSNLPALEKLGYDGVGLQNLRQLDFSHNPFLQELDLRESGILSLDLTNNPDLELLNLNLSSITTLNVTGCQNLKYLYAEDTRLTELDVTQCPALESLDLLYCSYIPTVNTSNNPNLQLFYTGMNTTSLDLSNNTELRHLIVEGRALTALDVTPCTNLEFLEVYWSQLSALDLSRCTALQHLVFHRVPLESLNLTNNTALEELTLTQCRFHTLDLSSQSALKYFAISVMSMDTLDVSPCKALVGFNAGKLFTDEVIFGTNANLRSLAIDSSTVSRVDVSGLPNLEHLELARDDSIAALDVSHNPRLTQLRCDGESLQALDVTHCPLLEELIVCASQISSLDLSRNPHLKNLLCYWTNLEFLDLSNNHELGQPTSEHVDFEPAPGCPDILSGIQVYESHMSHISLPDDCALTPSSFFGYGNVRSVDTAGGVFDLNTLEGFDVSRASDWTGGHVDGTILTFEGDAVSYRYDCGAGFTEQFTLKNASRKTVDGVTYRLFPDGTAEVLRCEKGGAVTIPAAVDGHAVIRLAYGAFSGNHVMTSLALPASVEYLSDHDPVDNQMAYMFTSCNGLQSITVDANNPRFRAEEGALYSRDMEILYCYPNAKAGAEYHIPASVVFIDDSAIARNPYLEDVYIENPDATWFGVPFTCSATIHYRLGGSTEEQVLNEEIVDWVPFGDDAGGATLEELAEQVVGEVTDSAMSDREKALALHDWVVCHTRYSLRRDGVRSLLVYGEARCAGYTDAYRLLLHGAGIQSQHVSGRDSTGAAHAWNSVTLGDILYYVDCTWDDPGTGEQTEPVSGFERHTYFLVSPQYLAQDHTFGDTTALQTTGWAEADGGMIFRDRNGNRVTGWLEIDGGKFYFDEDGLSVIGTVNIEGEEYTFGRSKIYTDDQGVKHYAGRLTEAHEHVLVADGSARAATASASGMAPELVCSVCGEVLAESQVIAPDRALFLPARLAAVEAEAFAGLQMALQITVPDGTKTIGAKAFAGCTGLRLIVVPASVQTIADDAFEGCDSLCLLVSPGSEAERYAQQHALPCVSR